MNSPMKLRRRPTSDYGLPVLIVNPIRLRLVENRAVLLLDIGFVQTDLGTIIDLLRSRVTLEAEIVVLRQRLVIVEPD
jgi:hypothetical protein